MIVGSPMCKFFAFDEEERPTSWSQLGGTRRACLTAIQDNYVARVSPPTHSFELTTLVNIFGQNAKFFNEVHYKLENLKVLQLGIMVPNNANRHPVQIVNTQAFFRFFVSLKSSGY